MTSISSINKTEYALLQCLSQSLQQTGKPAVDLSLTDKEWQQLSALADRHEVLSLLENVWKPERFSREQWQTIQSKTAKTVLGKPVSDTRNSK